MKNIIIYCNKSFDRDFHYLLENISLYIQKHFDAEILEVSNSYTINLFDEEVILADCEILIYIRDIDSFRCISFSDVQSQLISFLVRRNNPNDLIIHSQYIVSEFWSNGGYMGRWKPGIYTPFTFGINYEQFYNRRMLIKNKIDKFYFNGNYLTVGRGSIPLLKNTEFFKKGEMVDHLKYLDDAIKYKVGLSIPGAGEICFRDIEYMALGIPMLKIEYATKMNPELIPNYHYISIDRDDDKSKLNQDLIFSVGMERDGSELYAQKYINRFLEVKDNNEFLEFISKNAKEYYDTYLSDKNNNRINHIINFLEL